MSEEDVREEVDPGGEGSLSDTLQTYWPLIKLLNLFTSCKI